MEPGAPDPFADLPPETQARLHAYAALLATWSVRINLVSRNDIPHIWTRHVQDSLRLLPLMPHGVTRAIDIGSGGGLPGLVLAIASGIPFDLVESDRRKCAFLTEAARQTAAPVTVHHTRIETCGLPPATLLTARALAPLPDLLRLAAPLLAPGGTMMFPKGVRAEQELADAAVTHRFRAIKAGAPSSPVLMITQLEPAAAEAANA